MNKLIFFGFLRFVLSSFFFFSLSDMKKRKFEYVISNTVVGVLIKHRAMCHNRTFNGSGRAIVRHSLSNDK